MALTVAELAFVFGADTSKVDRALDGVDAKTKRAATSASTAMSGFWNKNEQQASRFSESFGKMASRVKLAAGGLAAGLVGTAIFKGWGRLTSLENAQAKLTGLGHSAETVTGIMDNALASVKGTAFGLDEAATVAAGAVASGIRPGEDLERVLRGVADAATIGGASMGEMGAIFNKVAATGKVQGDILNQLGDRGIPIIQLLAKELDTTAAGVIEMSEKGQIGFEAFAAAMEAGMGGAALKSGETMTGAFKNTLAAMGRIGANLMSGVYPQVAGFFSGSMDLMSGFEDKAKAAGATLGAALSAGAAVAVPALGQVAGATVDVVQIMGQIPAPVYGAVAAFAALKVAANLGWIDTAARGVRSVASGMDSLRLRTMFAADAFRTARDMTIELNGNFGKVTQATSRTTAAARGMAAGFAGAGAGIKKSLGSVATMLGGPWGIGLGIAAGAVTAFWQEQRKAKQHVDELAASLDQQTGAITENTREIMHNTLLKEGAYEAGKRLGLAAETVHAAAMGEADALEFVNRALEEQVAKSQGAYGNLSGLSEGTDKATRAALNLAEILGVETGVLADNRRAHDLKRRVLGESTEATEESKEATDDAASAIKGYRDRLRETRTAIQELANEENERRIANVTAKRDELALLIAKKEARKEAREGKRTLDENTKAGKENWETLLTLADQWNTSSGEVTQAKGAYKAMREEFIANAETMGATEKRAKRLADRYLAIPENVKTRISTPGIDRAQRQIDRLRASLDYLSMGGDFATPTEGRNRPTPQSDVYRGPGYAKAGYTGDGPKYQIAGPVHRGEFVFDQAKTRANRGLFEAIQAGSPVKMGNPAGMGASAPAPAAAGLSSRDFDRLAELVVASVQNARPLYGDVNMQPHNYNEFARQMEQDRRQSAGDGIRRR